MASSFASEVFSPLKSTSDAQRLRYPAVAGEITLDDATLTELVGLSERYSGAEIEQAIISGLFDAFCAPEDSASTRSPTT